MKKIVVIILMFILITGCQSESQDQTRADDTADAEAISLSESARLAEESARASEKKRLEEESRKRESQEKSKAEAARLAELAARTYYLKKDGALYQDEALSELTETVYPAYSKVLVAEDEPLYNEASEIIGYRVEAIDEQAVDGYFNVDQLNKELTDFIVQPYQNVDYTPFERGVYADNPPVKVKGIFLTRYTASNEKRLDELIEATKTSGINAFVIDVKDDSDHLLFHSKTAEEIMPEANSDVAIDDMAAFVKKLKDNDIYLIARVVCFKSPRYAEKYPERVLMHSDGRPFRQGDGLAWASAYDRQLWDYVLGISKEAAAHGFNEIQFDYVRFPEMRKSVKDQVDFHNERDENQAQAIQNFVRKAYQELSAMQVYVTTDVFGWIGSAQNDVGIGQHWEALSNSVDYMAPMIYPSHYGKGNFGITYPDTKPYLTIKGAMEDILARNRNIETPAKVRPWIQDFTASYLRHSYGNQGYIKYGPEQIKAQIRALEEQGVDEFMLWNSGNYYHFSAIPLAEE